MRSNDISIYFYVTQVTDSTGQIGDTAATHAPWHGETKGGRMYQGEVWYPKDVDHNLPEALAREA